MIGTLQQVFEDMEDGVYDFTKDGKCSSCGACCANYLPLSSSEIKEIKRYIKKHHIKEQKHITPTMTPTLDLTCPFLDDSKEKDKCTIYPVRGEICSSFICNDPHGARKNKKILHGKYRIVNMRKEFFGVNDGKTVEFNRRKIR